jgi:3-deoxy-D-manno-octulosonic-acid transferase
MILYAALYRLLLGMYSLAIHIAASFNPKAKLFVAGRKNLLPMMRRAMVSDARKRIWIHCASLGEFEQGRPVIDNMRRQYPECAIVLTFFSPSGYEVRKDYPGADYVFYLPVDNNRNAKQFLDIVNPSLCVFVKYELWYSYLSNIAARHIPALLISAIFRKDQGFFKWYGGLQRYMLRCFTHIFVQDTASRSLLESINIKDISISGDTRFDRVIVASHQAVQLPVADVFCQGHKIIVAGSTWHGDEVLLQKVLTLLPAAWKLILVPHEVHEEHIAAIEKMFAGNVVRWCQWDSGSDKRVLLVDTVGLLSKLYRYGTFAWIGGGFGKAGVHNVPEAAVYGIPCFFGPVFRQFLEAQELVAKGGAFTLSSPQDLVAAIGALADSSRYTQAAKAAKEYIYSGAGATACIMSYIKENIKLND